MIKNNVNFDISVFLNLTVRIPFLIFETKDFIKNFITISRYHFQEINKKLSQTQHNFF